MMTKDRAKAGRFERRASVRTFEDQKEERRARLGPFQAVLQQEGGHSI
jgi:hypothetical protein